MPIFNYNGNDIELPKKTLSLVKKEDAMHRASTLEDAYRKQYDYAIAVLGKDNFQEIFGTTDINDIDLTELTFVINLIDECYLEKVNQQNIERATKMIDNKAIDKLIATGESVKNIDAMSKRK